LIANDASVGRWVLDPESSRVEFHIKHFWGAITVHGSFSKVSGEGSISSSRAITGQLVVDAASLTTKNKKRDAHLRSADFFDVDHHPHVVMTVTDAKHIDPATLTCQGTLEAAGHVRPIAFSVDVKEVADQAVTLRAELAIDRTEFDMTWSPLGMASKMARAIVVARFVRS